MTLPKISSFFHKHKLGCFLSGILGYSHLSELSHKLPVLLWLRGDANAEEKVISGDGRTYILSTPSLKTEKRDNFEYHFYSRRKL